MVEKPSIYRSREEDEALIDFYLMKFGFYSQKKEGKECDER